LDKDTCGFKGRFTFLMVKESPITEAEHAHLRDWEKMLAARYGTDSRSKGIKWRYFPQEKINGEWSKAVLTPNVYDLNGVDKTKHNMSIITDDQPYPNDVYTSRAPQWAIFKNVSILAFIMVLLPTIVTFFARRRASHGFYRASSLLNNFFLVLFFAILGIGYLLIETVLIQRMAIFLDSPVTTLVVVLGTMLLSSGIGGYFSSRISKKAAMGSLFAVLFFAALAGTVYGSILDVLMFLPFAIRVIVAIVLVGLPGFFMGMPFPFAIGVSKESLSPEHAGLMFGINGAMGAIASPLALILSMAIGFNITMVVGGAAYLICLILLLPVEVRSRFFIQAKDEKRDESGNAPDSENDGREVGLIEA
jgi:hypothetical protein